MRAFGTDAPDFMAFRLGDGETVYRLPLAHCLPMTVNCRFAEVAAEKDRSVQEAMAQRLQVEILTDYLGAEAVEGITAAQANEIFSAWQEESRKAAGVSAGE